MRPLCGMVMTTRNGWRCDHLVWLRSDMFRALLKTQCRWCYFTFGGPQWKGRRGSGPVPDPAAYKVPEEFVQVMAPGSAYPNVCVGRFPASGAWVHVRCWKLRLCDRPAVSCFASQVGFRSGERIVCH